MHSAKKLLILILLLLNVTAFGQAGANKFRFSGRLSDSGILIASGSVDFRFRVFDLPTGGSQFGTDVVVTDVLINNGEFSVIVDLSQGPYVNGQSYWAEAAVRIAATGPYTALSPRKQFTIGTSHGLKMFRQPGTNYFVVPAGVHQIFVEAWAGGGGGAGQVQHPIVSIYPYGGPGGGGGGYAKGTIWVIPGTTNVILIGAGGTAGSNSFIFSTNTTNGITVSGDGFKGGDTKILAPLGNPLLLVTGGTGGTNTFTNSGALFHQGGSGGSGDTNMSIYQTGQNGFNPLSYPESPYSAPDAPAAYFFTPGTGGTSALGSAQTGRTEYFVLTANWEREYYNFLTIQEGGPSYQYLDSLNYDQGWSMRPVTFGHGGSGYGENYVYGASIFSLEQLPCAQSGTDGCVILQEVLQHRG